MTVKDAIKELETKGMIENQSAINPSYEQEQQIMLKVRALEEANKTMNFDDHGQASTHNSESLVKAAKEIYEFLKGE